MGVFFVVDSCCVFLSYHVAVSCFVVGVHVLVLSHVVLVLVFACEGIMREMDSL